VTLGTDPNNPGVFRLNGSISEIIHYNNTLSNVNLQFIQGYLATKWGISQYLPPSHPFYKVAIANISTVATGVSAASYQGASSATFQQISGATFQGASAAQFIGDSRAKFIGDSGAKFIGDSGSKFIGDSRAQFQGDSRANFIGASAANFQNASTARFQADSRANFQADSRASYEGDSRANFIGASTANFQNASTANFQGDSKAQFQNESGSTYISNLTKPYITSLGNSMKAIPGIQLWLDSADPAATGTAPAAGSAVSTWMDKSGVGNNATGVGSPTYTAAGITFNGSSQYFSTNLTSHAPTESAFAVVSLKTLDTPSGILGFDRIRGREWWVVGGTMSWKWTMTARAVTALPANAHSTLCPNDKGS
jgi:hypothetical protein